MTIFIGVDPGLSGAVAIISGDNVFVFDAPKIKKKNTCKSDYDIPAMANIFRPYIGQDVKVVIEAVFSRPLEGVSSVFQFGRGKGLWEGIVAAFGFKVNMVTPQTWKKVSFPELIVDNSQFKDKKPKTKKEKDDLAKLRRIAKVNAKAKARAIASVRFPYLADRFKTVNSDGRAEALLIALHASKNFKE